LKICHLATLRPVLKSISKSELVDKTAKNQKPQLAKF
jgi:hypothetical protein